MKKLKAQILTYDQEGRMLQERVSVDVGFAFRNKPPVLNFEMPVLPRLPKNGIRSIYIAFSVLEAGLAQAKIRAGR